MNPSWPGLSRPFTFSARRSVLEHAERVHVGFQDRVLFLALARFHLAQAHDGAQSLEVEAVDLGLAEHVADVVGDRLLLLLELFHALDDRAQLILGKAGGGGWRWLGFCG